MNKNQYKFGQTIMEPLISIGIVAFVFIMFILTLKNLLLVRVKTKYKIQASRLAQEGIEIAYNMAANNWTDFQAKAEDDKLYKPVEDSGVFKLEEGVALEHGRFNRSIEIEPARRDINKNISYDPADQVDDNTLRVISNVNWIQDGKSLDIEYVTFLINFQ